MQQHLLPIALSLFLLAGAARAAEPAGYDGDVLGMTFEAFKAKHAAGWGFKKGPYCASERSGELFLSDRDAKAGVVSCALFPTPYRPDAYRTEFEGVAADIFYQFYQDRLFRIVVNFDADQFSRVAEKLTAKYGPPSGKHEESYTVRLGGSFRNDILEWRCQEASATAKKYSTSLFHGGFQLQHDALNAALAKLSDSNGQVRLTSSR
jgi:hypothetical protein